MKLLKSILKWILYILLIPIAYLIISLLLTAITVDRENDNQVFDKTIYLNTNGVHLDIILPKKDVDPLLLNGIQHESYERYLAFGWGDEDFYINTPTWEDLTFTNAFSAMFLKSSTLMHVTRYRSKYSDWVEVKISENELRQLNAYLLQSFQTNQNGEKLFLRNQGYTPTDDFYKAVGSYSCLNTCNSWANLAFKRSGLKACLWTPFDFGLLSKYE
ncbi:MAG: DUF2459 domain-containing protein [Bacteroidota bacterium]